MSPEQRAKSVYPRVRKQKRCYLESFCVFASRILSTLYSGLITHYLLLNLLLFFSSKLSKSTWRTYATLRIYRANYALFNGQETSVDLKDQSLCVVHMHIGTLHIWWYSYIQSKRFWQGIYVCFLERDWIRGLIFSYAGSDLRHFLGSLGPRQLDVNYLLIT